MGHWSGKFSKVSFAQADEVGLERPSSPMEERSSPAMDMPELVQQGSPEALKLREAMQACTCRKFDMSKGPLFHVDVFRVGPCQIVCLQCIPDTQASQNLHTDKPSAVWHADPKVHSGMCLADLRCSLGEAQYDNCCCPLHEGTATICSAGFW